MRPLFAFSLAIWLLLFTFLSTFAAESDTISPNPINGIGADVEKRVEIKSAFLYNYNNYVKNAFPKDEIDLETLKGADDGACAGFGCTAIEALSTMIVMNLTQTDNFKNALKVVQNQSFTKTSVSAEDGLPVGTVYLFELTIRLIGGMLSAFQMNGEKQEERYLVNKTKTLADRIKGSWVNGAKIPVAVWNINNQSAYNLSATTNMASAGTLTLEWDRLSKFTHDDHYRRLAVGSVDAIRGLEDYFTGLPYVQVHPNTLKYGKKYITLGGGFDSYLEYLLKYPLLLGQPDHPYLKTWSTALESIQNHLIFKTGVNNFTFGADYDAERQTPVLIFSHLACFLGGNVAMGGRVLGNDALTTLGLELSESCAATYEQTALQIGPYSFGYADQTGNFTGFSFVSQSQREFYNQHGMFVSIGPWYDAPEVIESIFYSWRITGNQMWRDIAWKIFLQIKKVADTGHGYAPIQDVNDDSSGIFGQQPSFLYSETIKYLYLIFDDPQHYSLDEIVFNTEGMPFKRTPSQGFKTIQGTFPYSFLYFGKSDLDRLKNAKLANTNPGQKPKGLYTAKVGEDKQGFVQQLSSETYMPEEVANDYLSRLS